MINTFAYIRPSLNSYRGIVTYLPDVAALTVRFWIHWGGYIFEKYRNIFNSKIFENFIQANFSLDS